jgi:hypothetical protein
MGVGGQCHTQATSTPPPERDPVPIVYKARRALGPVWMGEENLAPTETQSLDRPAHSESLYWLRELPYFPAHKTHFFPEKCDLNLTCVLCAEGKYYFQTYKYLYSNYTTYLS